MFLFLSLRSSGIFRKVFTWKNWQNQTWWASLNFATYRSFATSTRILQEGRAKKVLGFARRNTFTSTFGAESECIGIDASLRKSAAKFDDSENASSKKETLFIVVHCHMIFFSCRNTWSLLLKYIVKATRRFTTPWASAKSRIDSVRIVTIIPWNLRRIWGESSPRPIDTLHPKILWSSWQGNSKASSKWCLQKSIFR